MIITIDGPIATGKSSIAKKLAHAIGFIYFDTGAMYRSFTYGILKNGIDVNDIAAITRYLETFDFDIKIQHSNKRYFVDGEEVTNKIRGPEVTAAVSHIAAIKSVRAQLVQVQRELAKGVNAVFEGRDMGTVVFPDADVKIFLTGEAEVRARRRYKELKEKYANEYEKLDYTTILNDINARDHHDATRPESPLKQAEDACVIDTTHLSIAEVVFRIQEYKDSLKHR